MKNDDQKILADLYTYCKENGNAEYRVWDEGRNPDGAILIRFNDSAYVYWDKKIKYTIIDSGRFNGLMGGGHLSLVTD